MYWVKKSPIEISGLGKVVMRNGHFHVISAYLLDQENSGSTTDICPNAVAKLMYESREEEGHLNFWWHSHVNMGCFWSGTDTETIRQFGEQGWCLATVFNKKEDCRSAYYQKGDDFMPEIFVDDMDTTSKEAVNPLEIEWETEYKAKCKAKAYPKYNHNQTVGLGGLGYSSLGPTKEMIEKTRIDDVVPMTVADEDLAEWWADYNLMGEILDMADLSPKSPLYPLSYAQRVDIYDEFCEHYGDSPMSLADLNLFFSVTLQGDIRAI